MSTKKSRTPRGRENQCIALAYDLVETRLREGTATSQETVHFLKLATRREELELEKLRSENELLKAKTEAVESSKEVKELFLQATDAMRLYSGEQ